MADILAAVERSFAETYRRPFALALQDGGDVRIRHCSSDFAIHDTDLQAATAAILCGRRTACGSSCFLPLGTADGVLGSIGFKAEQDSTGNDVTESPLFPDFVNQAALAVLRGKLYEQAQESARFQQADQLQKALLNSISHNFRTPLAAIIGALNTIQHSGQSLDEATQRELIESARAEAERLNRSLSNLLDMSRLEAGATSVRLDPCDVQDVIGASLEQLYGAARESNIRVTLPRELPFVRMDFVLIVQVLVNLLDNAIKYSPAHAPIDLEVRTTERTLEFLVGDSGDGIPQSELTHVFEKFNRAGRTGESGGIGLGLAICKGLVEAHGGQIRAEQREPRGIVLRVILPIQTTSELSI